MARISRWTQEFETARVVYARREASGTKAEIDGNLFDFEESLPPGNAFFVRVSGRVKCEQVGATFLDPPEYSEEPDEDSMRGSLFTDDDGSEGDFIRHLSTEECLDILDAGGYDLEDYEPENDYPYDTAEEKAGLR